MHEYILVIYGMFLGIPVGFTLCLGVFPPVARAIVRHGRR